MRIPRIPFHPAVFAAFFALGGVSFSAPVDFNRDIRPLLSDRCFACHGPDSKEREAGLRLDVETEAKADLGGYQAIVEGHPEASRLMQRILDEDPDDRMPPPESGKALSREEILLLRSWIAEGAPWAEHWAYRPPERHPIPITTNEEQAETTVDAFLHDRLKRERLSPAAEADRVTLIRRLHFDLTGLPPRPEDVDAFVGDKRHDAYERLVDRLLQSPFFGERMAMYWLDLVRYADTVGYHGDQDHNISPYRDYVIDAFNANMSFDRFTREQLGGDLMPEATVDQKIASGYNRLLQTSHEGGVQPEEYLAIYGADRVRNLSAVWMGATVGCAQCHDHKFDPYSTRDFYALQAFFADIDEEGHFTKGTNELPTARPPEITVLSAAERLRLAAVERALAESTSPDERRALERERAEILEARRQTMITAALEKPRITRVLPRGNWLDHSGEIVEPAVPAFLGRTLDFEDERADRLELARWLTDAESGAGGLTARVFVNRIWALLFGSGISPSLDDFGGQGKPPTHPELLDYLAIRFVESGWDAKQLVREIVTSRAYRKSSVETEEDRQGDPLNRLVTRQARFRLPAEMIRDTALHLGGLLVLEQGGASVKPYQPEGYYRHLNFPERRYEAHGDRRQWRRGVYMHWQRQFLHPMLKAFDAPMREECTAERARSNTPTAALALLNDPTFVEAARAFARRILLEGGDTDDERLRFAFRTALSRRPDETERTIMEGLLAEERAHFDENEDAAAELLKTGLSPVDPALDKQTWAAWTGVARAFLNLNETITRN